MKRSNHIEIREADCCHNCSNFRCERWSCFGTCTLLQKSPQKDLLVYFHNVCEKFDKNVLEMQFQKDD
jgi:hypothetical protein